MAPRARSRHAESDAAHATSIDDLPDVLLERILALLPSLKEQQRLALVSRRFAAAACSPALLRDVDAGELTSLPAVRSFTAWLLRHSCQLSRLAIHCGSMGVNANAYAAIATCLAIAGTQGQLLELEAHSPSSTEWLAAMPSLRWLTLSAWWDYFPLIPSPAISSLTALGYLCLEGGRVRLDADVQLPASITQLRFTMYECHEMPEQVAQLSQLAQLDLDECGFSAASMAQLSRLAGSLTRLDIEQQQVPDSLPALTRLQHLRIRCCEETHMPEAGIDAALMHLTQLTCLVLDVSELGLPAALPSLPRLQRCYLDKLIFEALPPGPWLHSLRWLGAPLGALIHSVATLRAAPALEYVCAESRGNEAEIWGSPAAAGLFNWLARHPPLRRVCFNALATQTAYNSLKFTAHVSQLARDRPALLVHCADSDGEALGTGSFMWLLDVE